MKNKKMKDLMPSYLKEGAIVVDVRSPGEFASGSSPGSINLPLDELEKRSKELDKHKKILLCCASGARSGMAASILKRNGFKDVVNVGAWTNTLG